MTTSDPRRNLSRRDFLAGCGAASALTLSATHSPATEAEQPEGNRGKALIAITFDLEMSRNFPAWETTHWDYEKGNLNEETKRYSVEAARRVKAAGALMHFFAVGRVFEQENDSPSIGPTQSADTTFLEVKWV